MTKAAAWLIRTDAAAKLSAVASAARVRSWVIRPGAQCLYQGHDGEVAWLDDSPGLDFPHGGDGDAYLATDIEGGRALDQPRTRHGMVRPRFGLRGA